ncbi:sulfuric ester hydrolase [Aureococcus anophagefferens]|nr:sulfuric ester hydrolase [Aureococcus anophagefferens]
MKMTSSQVTVAVAIPSRPFLTQALGERDDVAPATARRPRRPPGRRAAAPAAPRAPDASAAPPRDGEPRAKPPHVVFFLADDVGFGDVGYNGDPTLTNRVSTPVIDALADAGVKLSRYYTQPDCTPSRAALLSGKYPATTGTYHGVLNPQSTWGLPLEHALLPEALPGAYRSHAVGKWDVGHSSAKRLPEARGFDSFLGFYLCFYGPMIDYSTHEIHDHDLACAGDACAAALANCQVRGSTVADFSGLGGERRDYDGLYATDVFADRAVDLIEAEAADHPLFLYVAFNAVHGPLEADEADVAAFEATFLPESDAKRATFAAVALAMDRAIGRVVDALQATGAYENALVVFASDNGAIPGQMGGGSNWPLRGGKFSAWEGGVRVPAFVHSPLLPAHMRGAVYDGLFHVADWLPTIAAAAGAAVDSGDGVSHYRALFADGPAPRSELLVHVDVYGVELEPLGFSTGAYLEGDLKLVVDAVAASICSPDSAVYREEAQCDPSLSNVYGWVLDGDGYYADYFTATGLFDVVADPGETTDLSAERPDDFDRLYAKFRRAVRGLPAPEYALPAPASIDDAYLRWAKNDCTVCPWEDAGGDDAASNPPHLLLFLADDAGFDDVGYNSDPSKTNQVKTPFLDSLAAGGVKLARYYTQPDCTPSRAALLSGMYPASSGMYHKMITAQSNWGLDLDLELIPQRLPAAYRSHAVGKWDVGHYTWSHVPQFRGFRSFLGFYSPIIDYYTHETFDTLQCLEEMELTECEARLASECSDSIKDFNFDGDPLPLADGTYSTDVFAARARDLIRKEAPKHPLFLYVAFNAVHAPLEADEDVIESFASSFLEEARDARASFAAVALGMDRAMEAVVDELKAVDGAYENSVIMFASDNGGLPGQIAGGSNWPLRGQKFSPFEGGVRVPAFVHSPLLPAARRGGAYGGLFHVTDWLPTLVRLAGGAPPRNVDGVDQYEAIFGEHPAEHPRTELLVHVDVYGRQLEPMGLATGAYVEGDMKLIVNATDALWADPDSTDYRTEDHLWTAQAFYEAEVAAGWGSYADYFRHTALFNVTGDPTERFDLKASRPRELERLMAKFQAAVDALPEPSYTPVDCEQQVRENLCMDWVDNGCTISPWATPRPVVTEAPSAEPTRKPLANDRCAYATDTRVRCEYPGEVFLELPNVAAYFESVGVDRAGALHTYLPEKYAVEYDVGAADEGALAFGLYLPECDSCGPEIMDADDQVYDAVTGDGTYMTFLVVAAFDGAILKAAVVTDFDDGYGSTRVDAVKMHDPETVVAYTNVDRTESGYLYTWAWDSDDAPRRVNDHWTSSSHDVQLGPPVDSAVYPSAYYWQPDDTVFTKRRISDGAILERYDIGDICVLPAEDDSVMPGGSMNHLQLIDDEQFAFISCRCGAILLYDLAARPVWIAGGEYSTLEVSVADGVELTARKAVDVPWFGQHNAELFGDAVYMFDNGYDMLRPSRIPFDYPYGYAEIFGDADLLPSGNVLTCYWPMRLAPSLGADANATFLEVTPAGSIAWRADFYDTGATTAGPCEDDSNPGCERNKHVGWKAYSLERFYAAPLTKLNCPCGTVAYCSKSCQKSDWREGHKKVCKARREGHKKEAADAAASAPVFGHYIQTPEDKCSLKIRGKPCPLCRKPWPKTHAMMLAYLRKNVDSGVPEAMNQLGDFYRFGRVDASGRKNPNKAANCVEINQ